MKDLRCARLTRNLRCMPKRCLVFVGLRYEAVGSGCLDEAAQQAASVSRCHSGGMCDGGGRHSQSKTRRGQYVDVAVAEETCCTIPPVLGPVRKVLLALVSCQDEVESVVDRESGLLKPMGEIECSNGVFGLVVGRASRNNRSMVFFVVGLVQVTVAVRGFDDSAKKTAGIGGVEVLCPVFHQPHPRLVFVATGDIPMAGACFHNAPEHAARIDRTEAPGPGHRCVERQLLCRALTGHALLAGVVVEGGTAAGLPEVFWRHAVPIRNFCRRFRN